MRPRVAGGIAAVLCLLFLVCGSLWIEKPGIQADEALFSMGNFYPQGVGHSMRAFHRTIPLMQMSYLGSLKAWVWAPVFALTKPGAASLRYPAVVFGAAMLWLLYCLLCRLSGPATGLLALAFLALDPLLLFTTRCDWGPVALQHLLTVGALLAAVTGRFSLAAFLAGLALWDKMVAVWILGGLGAAALLFYWREVRAAFTWRRLLLVLLAGALGCWPVIRYNYISRGRTVEQTGRFSLADVPGKAEHLVSNLDGTALFGYLVRDAEGYGPRRTITPWLLIAGAALAIWRRSRPALFLLTGSTLAWLLMVATVGGGGSAHHVGLLWPWPHAMAALAIANAWPRRQAVLAAIGIVALISGGLVTARYYRLLLDKGSDPPWSDAIYQLAHYVEDANPPKVMVNDWGILDPLRLLTAGSIPIETSHDRPPADTVYQPGVLFVEHTDAHQAFAGVNARIRSGVRAKPEILQRFADSKGNEIFEVFRFKPDP